MINTLISLATITCSFIAGWLVATDKYRDKILGMKINTYHELNRQLAKTLNAHTESEYSKEQHTKFIKECVNLSQFYLENSIFISKEVRENIEKLFSYKDWNDNNHIDIFNNVNWHIRKKLKSLEIEFVNDKLYGSVPDILRKIEQVKKYYLQKTQ